MGKHNCDRFVKIENINYYNLIIFTYVCFVGISKNIQDTY